MAMRLVRAGARAPHPSRAYQSQRVGVLDLVVGRLLRAPFVRHSQLAHGVVAQQTAFLASRYGAVALRHEMKRTAHVPPFAVGVCFHYHNKAAAQNTLNAPLI
jgi:hypothetical protein